MKNTTFLNRSSSRASVFGNVGQLGMLVMAIGVVGFSEGAFSDSPLTRSERRSGMELRGEWSGEQLLYLDTVVAQLPAEMVKAVPSITLVVELGKSEKNGLAYSVVGSTDKENGAIVIQSGALQTTLVHEIAHAYTLCLKNEGNSLGMAWQLVAGDVYGKTKVNSPTKGLLSQYGATNYFEDIAEWVRVLYSDDSKVAQALQKNRDLDIRFASKLELLNNYGFLTAKTYAVWSRRINP